MTEEESWERLAVLRGDRHYVAIVDVRPHPLGVRGGRS